MKFLTSWNLTGNCRSHIIIIAWSIRGWKDCFSALHRFNIQGIQCRFDHELNLSNLTLFQPENICTKRGR